MSFHLKLGLCITCFALFLTVIPAAIPYWWSHTFEKGDINVFPEQRNLSIFNETTKMNFGLSRWCNKSMSEPQECFSYEAGKPWLEGAFGIMFVAILAITAGAVVTVLYINIFTKLEMLCVCAAGLCLLGAGADVASLILFGVNASDFFVLGSFGAAFGVTIVAAVLAVVAAIVLFRFRRLVDIDDKLQVDFRL